MIPPAIHRLDLPLANLRKVGPIRKPAPYHPVMYFIAPFFPGGVGITVIDGESLPAQHGLDQQVMFQELRPVIRGDGVVMVLNRW